MINSVLTRNTGFSGLIFGFTIILLFASGTIFAENYLGNKIIVTYIPNASNSSQTKHNTRHGYVEYRFRIQNNDTKKHHVGLTVPNNAGPGNQGVLIRATNGADIGPNDSVVLSVLQPPLPIAHQNIVAVTIDGGMQEKQPLSYVSLDSHCRYIRSYEQVGHLFVSKDIPSDMWVYFESGNAVASSPPSRGSFSMASSDSINIWRSELECNEWSTNWLSHTRFDGIAITDNELKNMPPEIFQGVRRFVEAGGTLIIVGKNWTCPKEWQPLKNTGSRRVFVPDSDQYGAVLGLAVAIPSETENAKPAIDAIRSLLFADSNRWAVAMESDQAHYRGFGYHGGSSVGSLGGSGALLSNLPVISAFGVPVKPIMVLILLFAILIGPVNIYVLTMLKRRIWLLWTVPATSILASVIVLGVNFFQEGFVKHQSSASVTILDQRRGEAISFGVIGYYATLTPSGGIIFENSTEATHSFERNSTSRNFEVQDSGDVQNFSRGWISARLPSYFAIRKAQSRLERLDFQWTGDKPTVLNGLGVDIENLTVCAPDGKLYELRGKCQAGAKETMAPSTSGMAISTSDLANFQDNIMNADFSNIDNWSGAGRSSPSLAPGTYRAVVSGNEPNPFIEKGIEGMKPFQNNATIYGFF